MPDLHQEFAILCEFQDHVVVETTASDLSFVVTTPALGTAAIPGNPDIALVIDGDAVIGVRPIVTLTRTAPMPEKVALLIKLEDWRRSSTALRHGRVGCGMQFSRLKRTLPMNDPDMVLSVHRYPDCHALEPMIRQWLRPQRVHFESGRL